VDDGAFVTSAEPKEGEVIKKLPGGKVGTSFASLHIWPSPRGRGQLPCVGYDRGWWWLHAGVCAFELMMALQPCTCRAGEEEGEA